MVMSSKYDDLIVSIIDYAYDYECDSAIAWAQARLALLDALGCAMESLSDENVRRLIRPKIPGMTVQNGFRLPGTAYELDPVSGAFSLGSMMRYHDFNDAFGGKEWGHPSDNLGAIIAVSDWLARAESPAAPGANQHPPWTMHTLLLALIKSYEIQGQLQARNTLNAHGFDHVTFVKFASTAVVAWLMGLSKEQACAALSHAIADGPPLRAYRQAPDAGPRKGWAAADACARAVHLCLLVREEEPGLPHALTASKWGFNDCVLGGSALDISSTMGSWVVENVLFKVMPCEGHALTAVEAALLLRAEMDRKGLNVSNIDEIRVRTHKAALIIIDKNGPLTNPAARDHCLQYMLAVALLKGQAPSVGDYADESEYASNPAVDKIRDQIKVIEAPQFTADYHDPMVRSAASAIAIILTDASRLDEVKVDYPLGSCARGRQTVSAVEEKYRRNLQNRLQASAVHEVERSVMTKTTDMKINDFIDMFEAYI